MDIGSFISTHPFETLIALGMLVKLLANKDLEISTSDFQLKLRSNPATRPLEMKRRLEDSG